MPTKILLVNFTAREAERVQLPVMIERGYFGDIKKLSKQAAIYNSFDKDDDESKRKVNDIDFWFPRPIYEYNAVFINLNSNQELIEEFKDKLEKYTDADKDSFVKYWIIHHKPIILFLGDYGYQNLFNFGVPDFILKKVQRRDASINCIEKGDNNFLNFFTNSKSQVKMPTNYYISLEDKNLFKGENSEFKMEYLYWNNNSENLGVFIEYHKNYSSIYIPRIIILPQFKDNPALAQELIKELSALYPKLFPEIKNLDWANSDEYYPQEIQNYDNNIQKIINNAKKEIAKLQEEKEVFKKSYESLRGILINKGDDLKKNIMSVFADIFKLKVEDSDEQNKNLIFKEDIIIRLPDRNILAEIKGTKSENPPASFTGQVWKHILQHKERDNLEGCLIINYNSEINPQDRSLAYTGEEETGIQDIIFIDTRVIYNLAIAIIDYGMTTDEATEILFKKGRAGFNLEKYIEIKQKQSQEKQNQQNLEVDKSSN